MSDIFIFYVGVCWLLWFSWFSQSLVKWLARNQYAMPWRLRWRVSTSTVCVCVRVFVCVSAVVLSVSGRAFLAGSLTLHLSRLAVCVCVRLELRRTDHCQTLASATSHIPVWSSTSTVNHSPAPVTSTSCTLSTQQDADRRLTFDVVPCMWPYDAYTRRHFDTCRPHKPYGLHCSCCWHDLWMTRRLCTSESPGSTRPYYLVTEPPSPASSVLQEVPSQIAF